MSDTFSDDTTVGTRTSMFGGSPPVIAEPRVTGLIKASPEDFEVCEMLGFEPSGRGEHTLIQVQKRGLNTHDVQRRLGEAAGVPLRDVGCCGLKDKYAVSTQWFSIRDPAQKVSNWQRLDGGQLRVVATVRHNRKLRRGAHRGNRFRIRLREVTGGRERIEERLHAASTGGVPNFFGPQRFGRSNLENADDMFRRKSVRMSHARRGLLLSVARSAIFNEVLSRRVDSDSWNSLHPGDVAVLNGTNSFFRIDEVDATLQHRLDRFDIHPSGPLFGAGENPASGNVAVLESEVFEAQRLRCDGLISSGLKMERRALRLCLNGLQWTWAADDELTLCFELPRGGYATSVLGFVGRFHEPDRYDPGSRE